MSVDRRLWAIRFTYLNNVHGGWLPVSRSLNSFATLDKAKLFSRKSDATQCLTSLASRVRDIQRWIPAPPYFGYEVVELVAVLTPT